jgi:hypothetical protein
LLAKVLDLGAVLDGPTRLPSPLCWHCAPHLMPALPTLVTPP